MSIRVLPIHLVNKIAAGEVVERPASVVKELVENALDAGAGRIDVAVEDGGRKLISVTDDGCGMSPEDLALAFAPHATSKLAGEEELFRIATMGFRGEALASIAAISHAHIRTRRREDDSGYEVTASGQDVGPVRPCPAPVGTAVTVRGLFFNTPARRKFLRKANTEFGHVSEHLARLALAHPHVAFALRHNDRKVQNLPEAASTLVRARALFGSDLAEDLLPLARRKGAVGVQGLIAPPAAARASGKWQYFFVNGRFVRDRLLSHALREAYRGLVDPNRWPVAMLFLEMEAAEVDVNVHPTKIEVRFRQSHVVHGELLAALRETLNKAGLSPRAVAPDETGRTEAAAGDDRHGASVREAIADFFRSAPPPQPHLDFAGATPARTPQRTSAAAVPPASQAAPPPLAPAPPDETPEAPVSVAAAARGPIQVHESYIVASCEDGLIIVDQHALHERLIYNDLHRRLAGGALAGQRLLLPQTLRVTASEVAAIEARTDLLKRLGIELSPFGPDTVAIQQFPSLLAQRGVEPQRFIREFLDRLTEDQTVDSERLLEDVLQLMACKAAVKAGQPLTAEEMTGLLDRRQEAEKSASCPHGRPTTLKLTIKDLERQFKRT